MEEKHKKPYWYVILLYYIYYLRVCIYIYIYYIYIIYIYHISEVYFLNFKRYFKTGDVFERNIIKKIENIKSLDWKHRLPKIWILVENVKLWGSEPFENCYTTRVCYIKIDRKIVKKEKICLTYAMKHNFYTDPDIFYNDWETLSF